MKLRRHPWPRLSSGHERGPETAASVTMTRLSAQPREGLQASQARPAHVLPVQEGSLRSRWRFCAVPAPEERFLSRLPPERRSRRELWSIGPLLRTRPCVANILICTHLSLQKEPPEPLAPRGTLKAPTGLGRKLPEAALSSAQWPGFRFPGQVCAEGPRRLCSLVEVLGQEKPFPWLGGGGQGPSCPVSTLWALGSFWWPSLSPWWLLKCLVCRQPLCFCFWNCTCQAEGIQNKPEVQGCLHYWFVRNFI